MMESFEEAPVSTESPEETVPDTNSINETSLNEATLNDNSDEDSLWQQQLVETEKEIQKEKENNKRPVEENSSNDEPLPKKKASEIDKFWENVKENPSDFQAWTSLLQHIDQLGNLEAGREAYDGFFSHYPYCYGYWKKYTDLEKRKGTDESALKVFNRGLEAINLSVDLWIHYMEYITTKYPANEEFVREQFERSIDNCGLDFRSDRLWDLYLTWESNSKRWDRVTKIYDHLIAIPLTKYIQHWEKFQEVIKRHTPSHLMSPEEYAEMRKKVLLPLNRPDSELPDEAPPGVETTASEGQSSTNVDEENKLIREHMLESRQKVHDATAVEAKARWLYEDAIKRPYFHVKPLEKSQLNAWRNYLEYETKTGDKKRIRALFDRCLIATALYEEFWMKYIRYLEEECVSEDDLRLQYSRACKIHLKDKLRPHLSWAAFEEERGDYDAALSILKELQGNKEMCIEAYMMSVAIERRRGNIDAAEDVYLNCLAKWKNDSNKNLYGSIAVKYARFLNFFKNDCEKAIEIIEQAIQFDNTNFNLLIALADTALASRPPNFDLAAQAFKRGTESSNVPNVKLMFAHRYLHFVTECGSSSTSMNEALRLLRKTQQDVRQSQSEGNEANKTEETNSNAQKSVKLPSSAVPMEKAPLIPSSNVNGSVVPHGMQSNNAYPNYNQSNTGYGGYNQYPQNYAGGSQYQNWGYPNQQGAAYPSYNQQGWGSYPNYYGQR